MEEMQVYSYEQLDREIKRVMMMSANNLVLTGYLIRHMMEEKLWTREHASFDEYLERELHMDYTMATRFIKANKKYADSKDSTKIDSKYMDYSQSVLIEMLNMPPELEEKVTPDMTVKQVREVKKQKRTKMKPDVRGILADPYCAACGEPLDDSKQKCPNCGQAQDWEWYDRFFGDNDQSQETVIDKGTNETEVATSQQLAAPQDVIDVDYREVPEKLSAYGLPKTVYPEGSLLTTEGCGHKYSCFLCARECDIRQTERQCCDAPCGNPFGCQTMDKLGDIRLAMGEKCQFINDELAYKAAGDGSPDPCCKECKLKSECDFCCEAAKRQTDKETFATSQDPESAKPDVVLPDKEQTAVHGDEETPENENSKTVDEITRIRDILEKEKKLFSEYKGLEDIPEDTMFRQKTIVGALANMIYDLENMPEKKKQPILPILKNDSQRKEWLQNYKSWGLWYRDGNIDVNYYKYDFPDGSRLVVAEYPRRHAYYNSGMADEYYYHLLEKDRKNYDGCAYDAQYCQQTDSETYLVDFLKNSQKKGKP